MVSGVYKIYHSIRTDKCYVGSSKDVHVRFKEHLKRLRRGNHTSPHFQNLYNKYGESGLVLEVICESNIIGKHLRELEQLCINDFICKYGRQNLLNASVAAMNPTDDPVVEAKRLDSCKRYRDANKEKLSKVMSDRNKDKEFNRNRLEKLMVVINDTLLERAERFTQLRSTEDFKLKRYAAFYDSVVEPIVFTKLGQVFIDRVDAAKVTGYKYSVIGCHVNGSESIRNPMWMKKSDYDVLSDGEKDRLKTMHVRKGSSCDKYLKQLLAEGKIEENEEGKYQWSDQ